MSFFDLLLYHLIITLTSGIIDHYCITTKNKKKLRKNKNELGTIYPKNHENVKNRKPRVQFYWFLWKEKSVKHSPKIIHRVSFIKYVSFKTSQKIILSLGKIYSWFKRNITAQKMKFSINYFFSKCDQISSFLRIWSYLMKKSLMENFTFCIMYVLSEHKLLTKGVRICKKKPTQVITEVTGVKKSF